MSRFSDPHDWERGRLRVRIHHVLQLIGVKTEFNLLAIPWQVVLDFGLPVHRQSRMRT